MSANIDKLIYQGMTFDINMDSLYRYIV